MDDDLVLVGPVELLIQQAEELFVARTCTHGSGSLAERVGGRPRDRQSVGRLPTLYSWVRGET
jgi:hypothetical protein